MVRSFWEAGDRPKAGTWHRQWEMQAQGTAGTATYRSNAIDNVTIVNKNYYL